MRVFVMMVIGLVMFAAGCGGTGRFVGGTPSDLPEMRADVAQGKHAVVMTAPNPGWRVEYDGAELNEDGLRLLFTVRRPDPALQYAQVVSEKWALTQTGTDRGASIWVRVVDHGSNTGGYGLVTRVEAE